MLPEPTFIWVHHLLQKSFYIRHLTIYNRSLENDQKVGTFYWIYCLLIIYLLLKQYIKTHGMHRLLLNVFHLWHLCFSYKLSFQKQNIIFILDRDFNRCAFWSLKMQFWHLNANSASNSWLAPTSKLPWVGRFIPGSDSLLQCLAKYS